MWDIQAFFTDLMLGDWKGNIYGRGNDEFECISNNGL